ncbi:MAG: hypothetical protein ACD_42C00170G0004 [uncultured bacterium]|nr:MAG: hypothetical protein ACD_42C00170G0004 [uncultured bacterium]OGT33838.1 MAG: ATPase [Gammaproteobacteria bacterium RIFCSPHIGHO2_02_FULL_39_13]OGT48923.1 MAG: ATPase [Gammaproteobacteria bacterium RIFCSPHIGHO2_12_FULL_39_24]
MYLPRSLEKTIQAVSKQFRVILLTGPRQVGKTTLLEHVDKKRRSYVTLDDLNVRIAAAKDPATFIERLTLPVLIDEVQYAPALFPYIKMHVDQDKTPGLFWLTGSQQFDMMKNITESLAGRVAVLQLSGISLAEEQNRIHDVPFLPDLKTIRARIKTAKPLTALACFYKIWRGSYPDVVLQDGKNWERFYESYVTTYIQKDVRDYLQINDQVAFHRFMQVAASRTGQLINYRDLANDVGVSEPTIKSWINVLHASGIIYLLQPYFNNRTKRLIKTPKLYFMDTGLCCFLTGWLNADVLERGSMAGSILETYVFSEIIKSYLNCGRTPRIYFYRDKDMREIDFLLEENGVIYPIEIKKTASIKNINVNFDVLKKLKIKIGRGGVICFVQSPLSLSSDVEAIPVGFI